MNLEEMPLSEIRAYLDMCDHFDRITAPMEGESESCKLDRQNSKKEWHQIRHKLMIQYFKRADKIKSIL